MSKPKPLIVFYMHKVPYPPENGTNQRIYAMAAYLKKEYRIGLVVPEYRQEINSLYTYFDYIWYGGHYPDKLGRLRRYINNKWYLFIFKKRFKAHLLKFKNNPLGKYNVQAARALYSVCRLKKPSLIIVQKVFNSVLSMAIAHKFNIPVIIDTHDLFKLQNPTQPILISELKSATAKDELNILEQFEYLIAIQQQEAQVLKKYLPDKHIIVALHPAIVDLPKENNAGNSNKSPVLLFVGSAAVHNKIALQYFLEVHWEKILKEHPSTQLVVCGSVSEGLSTNYTNIQPLGKVNNLEPIYKEATLVINPVIQGSGLKIKTIDALAYGKCLVTTPIGVEGLPNVENTLLCIEPEKFAETITELLNDKSIIHSYEISARNYVKKYLSPEACFAELTNLLSAII